MARMTPARAGLALAASAAALLNAACSAATLTPAAHTAAHTAAKPGLAADRHSGHEVTGVVDLSPGAGLVGLGAGFTTGRGGVRVAMTTWHRIDQAARTAG